MATEATIQDMQAHITLIEQMPEYLDFCGVEHPSYNRYVYFNPGPDTDLKIGIGGGKYTLPLKLASYGFPDSRTVKIDQKFEPGVMFVPEAVQAYDLLIAGDDVSLKEALETIGYCVNRSMKYDFDCEAFHTTNEEYQKAALEAGYVPYGDETLQGICTDAGEIIRRMVGGMIRDSWLRYIHIAVNDDGAHDTTLIFDMTGRWAVMNSKSPFHDIQFNLASPEQLASLGYPYVC